MKKKNNTGRDLKVEDEGKVGRGMLTTDINKVAELMIGRKISQSELRLIAYVQYVMCNERKIKPALVNNEERAILQKWREEGHIDGGAGGLAVTKQFWDFMCEVLFLGYVGYDNAEIIGDTR